MKRYVKQEKSRIEITSKLTNYIGAIYNNQKLLLIKSEWGKYTFTVGDLDSHWGTIYNSVDEAIDDMSSNKQNGIIVVAGSLEELKEWFAEKLVNKEDENTLRKEVLNHYDTTIKKLNALLNENRKKYSYRKDICDAGLTFDNTNCPLCNRFGENDCKGCPVFNKTKEQYCCNTPFEKISSLSNNLYTNTINKGYFVKMKLIDYINAIKKERQFLSELDYGEEK